MPNIPLNGDLDLEEIVKFFMGPRINKMPESVKIITLSGQRMKYDEFRTDTIELKNLRENWAPDIASQIESGYNLGIPVVRHIGTPNYFVYHPETGKYLGSFAINEARVSS